MLLVRNSADLLTQDVIWTLIQPFLNDMDVKTTLYSLFVCYPLCSFLFTSYECYGHQNNVMCSMGTVIRVCAPQRNRLSRTQDKPMGIQID